MTRTMQKYKWLKIIKRTKSISRTDKIYEKYIKHVLNTLNMFLIEQIIKLSPRT